MKNLNFSNLVKDKLTGEEAGRLMLKDQLSLYMAALNDKDVLSGKKKPEALLSENDIKAIINKISGEYNIENYNNYIKLERFLGSSVLSQVGNTYEIDVNLWKMMFFFYTRETMPFKVTEEEQVAFFLKMINHVNDNIKEFLFYSAVFQLISAFTKVDEIGYLPNALPEDLIKMANSAIEAFNILKKTDLPAIIDTPISEENICQALNSIRNISDLFNENYLRELLIPEEVSSFV